MWRVFFIFEFDLWEIFGLGFIGGLGVNYRYFMSNMFDRVFERLYRIEDRRFNFLLVEKFNFFVVLIGLYWIRMFSCFFYFEYILIDWFFFLVKKKRREVEC